MEKMRRKIIKEDYEFWIMLVICSFVDVLNFIYKWLNYYVYLLVCVFIFVVVKMCGVRRKKNA